MDAGKPAKTQRPGEGTRDELLELLSDGQVHSGQALAKALGITRAGVWKQLQRLGELGVEVASRHGRGYQLHRRLELLDPGVIHQHLADDVRSCIAALEVHHSIDSTNRYLLEAGADPQITPARLCLAEHQSAGRGRRGRQWQSPFGASIYLSLRWQFEETPAQLPALALAAGVVVAQTLEALGVNEIGLKWPNDLYWGGRKLGGILLEMRGEAGGASDVVIGLGLNVSMPSASDKEIDQPWVDLQEILGSSRPHRAVLAGQLSTALCRGVQDFCRSGFAAFAQEYARRDVLDGHAVSVEQAGQALRGVARGIEDDGALRVCVDGDVRRFVSGDVSLRRIA